MHNIINFLIHLEGPSQTWIWIEWNQWCSNKIGNKQSKGNLFSYKQHCRSLLRNCEKNHCL